MALDGRFEAMGARCWSDRALRVGLGEMHISPFRVQSGAARIEEVVVVTDDGCDIITNFPSDHLISCGLPGCEIY